MAKLKFQKTSGDATVTKTVIDNKAKANISEDVVQEKVEAPPVKEAPAPKSMPDVGIVGDGNAAVVGSIEPYATLGVEASFTKNLGNYQSARISVKLDLPSPVDELEERFDFATEWVNGKLEGLLATMGDGEEQAA